MEMLGLKQMRPSTRDMRKCQALLAWLGRLLTLRCRLVLIITTAGIPIFLSMFRWLPFPMRLVSWFNATFIDPPLIGEHHRVPWLSSFIVPTRGQGLFIAYIIIINIILCSIGYEVRWPNSWYVKPMGVIVIECLRHPLTHPLIKVHVESGHRS
jgi:hypothetical protein